jgi:hypothetical protein
MKMRTILLLAALALCIVESKRFASKSTTSDGGACGTNNDGYFGKQSDCYSGGAKDMHGMNHKFCCSFPLVDLSTATSGKREDVKMTMGFDNQLEKAKNGATKDAAKETELRNQKITKKDEATGGKSVNEAATGGDFCWKLFRCWATEYECLGDYTDANNAGLIPCLKEYDGCYTRRRAGTCKRTSRFQFESYAHQANVVSGAVAKNKNDDGKKTQ